MHLQFIGVEAQLAYNLYHLEHVRGRQGLDCSPIALLTMVSGTHVATQAFRVRQPLK